MLTIAPTNTKKGPTKNKDFLMERKYQSLITVAITVILINTLRMSEVDSQLFTKAIKVEKDITPLITHNNYIYTFSIINT